MDAAAVPGCAMTRRRRQLRQVASTPRRRDVDRHGSGQIRAERRQQRRAAAADRRDLLARYRSVGGPRGQRRRFGGRVAWHTRVEGMELSTAALEAAYPWQVASRTGRRAGEGIAVGPSATGGTWVWDPWVAYRTGRLSNPNVLIVGEIGSGKSALAKSLVWRGLEFGRGGHIIDRKGEYGPLAAAAGVQPLALRPGGRTVLNPLDPGAAGRDLDPQVLFHRNVSTVRALLEATLGRACRQLEMVVLSRALAQVSGLDPTAGPARDHGQVATLTMLAEALVAPPASVAQAANMDPRQVVDESREMALALSRLVDDHGDLGGMFAGPTNLEADPLADLTVVDISGISELNPSALPLVMICTSAWLQLATRLAPQGRWQLNDEGWMLLSNEATARWTQTNMKLARQLGLSVINVLHRLSDSKAAGQEGSATRALAEGVIADSGTVVVYRQKPSEQPALGQILGLNRVQARTTSWLGTGCGLWLMGGQPRQVALVDHVLSDIERTLTDTDQVMCGVDRELSNPDPSRQGRP